VLVQLQVKAYTRQEEHCAAQAENVGEYLEQKRNSCNGCDAVSESDSRPCQSIWSPSSSNNSIL
jgi:hypothetical protein